ncbi:MAG: Rieske 2Fe-2S domain-containing protein [Actinobacteria bacterium]|nr:Rieske 2Fe-2S domain-containing protein [Actinomycetota bacterium]
MQAPTTRVHILSWSGQSWTARILRGWLGGNFVYAGWQKLSDPGFLKSGTSSYIGLQLSNFAKGSPIAPFLHAAGHAPVLAGIGTAVGEIAIGLATLAGILPELAALLGLGLSLTLWLSATWHVHPYFLRSDSIYTITWLAYLVSFPMVLALFSKRPTTTTKERNKKPAASTLQEALTDRRQILGGGVIIAISLVLGGIAASVGKSPAPASARKRVAKKASGGTHPKGTVVASLADVQSQGTAGFQDANGSPAVVVSLGGGAVAAFSRVCTHAGCSMDFDPSSKQLICPCHGATYDPAHGAQVTGGPSPSPLSAIKVSIDKTTGEIYQV